MERYFITSNLETLEVVAAPFETQPENSLPYEPNSFFKACFDVYPNPTTIVEGATQEEINDAIGNVIALHHCYPNLSMHDYKLLNLDNLQDIWRDNALADRGLKGEKKYYNGDFLVWSTEKKYWFEENAPYVDGFVRTIKLFKINGEVADSWSVKVKLTDDDKQFFREEQRRMIFNYFKSQRADLFNLLYTFFKPEIDDYVMKGGSELADALTAASVSHPYEPVMQTLNTEISTPSGATITVLQGILYELV